MTNQGGGTGSLLLVDTMHQVPARKVLSPNDLKKTAPLARLAIERVKDRMIGVPMTARLARSATVMAEDQARLGGRLAAAPLVAVLLVEDLQEEARLVAEARVEVLIDLVRSVTEIAKDRMIGVRMTVLPARLATVTAEDQAHLVGRLAAAPLVAVLLVEDLQEGARLVAEVRVEVLIDLVRLVTEIVKGRTIGVPMTVHRARLATVMVEDQTGPLGGRSAADRLAAVPLAAGLQEEVLMAEVRLAIVIAAGLNADPAHALKGMNPRLMARILRKTSLPSPRATTRSRPRDGFKKPPSRRIFWSSSPKIKSMSMA